MRPHKKFFSSLKQVEKRMKLENGEAPSAPSQQDCTLTDSVASPLYLDFDPTNGSSCKSETPRVFLSSPSPSSASQEVSVQVPMESEISECDEIEELMALLGLSEEGDDDIGGCSCNSCNCEGGFYEKIVGVEGPKCVREVARLNGWIEHFRKEKKEPFRLAHLLLGKASLHSGDDELEFPSTLDEFLKNDPPLSG
uniref:Uncharacterized protein n=1 Tax=Kalanchoe fedtschenkoi TaxID=63787 RepID=A0A7N0SWB0_KALFE